MNILLTGGSGFIGSHLLKYIQSVSCTDNIILLTSRKIEGFTCILHHNYCFSKKDFTDAGIDRIDVVLLLGAYVEKQRGEAHCAQKNISSINNLIYLLENIPGIPKKIIYCSSISVYGFDSKSLYIKNPAMYNEMTRIAPVRTYALSKALGERFVEEWARERQCDFLILRIGVTYGTNGGNGRGALDFLGMAIHCAVTGTELSMYASPEQIWNFVCVLDVVKWIFSAIFLDDDTELINLTSSYNYTSLEVCEIIKKVWPDFRYRVITDRIYKGNDKAFDSSKREQLLGEETYPLLDGLTDFKEHLEQTL